MKKQTMVETHLQEQVNYGGEIMTRGEMIVQLQKAANGDQRLVDRYLQGHGLTKRGSA